MFSVLQVLNALTNLNTGTGYPCEGQNKTWGDSAKASTELLFSFPEVNLGATDPIGSETNKNIQMSFYFLTVKYVVCMLSK